MDWKEEPGGEPQLDDSEKEKLQESTGRPRGVRAVSADEPRDIVLKILGVQLLYRQGRCETEDRGKYQNTGCEGEIGVAQADMGKKKRRFRELGLQRKGGSYGRSRAQRNRL